MDTEGCQKTQISRVRGKDMADCAYMSVVLPSSGLTSAFPTCGMLGRILSSNEDEAGTTDGVPLVSREEALCSRSAARILI